jgi:hypothetical protein
MSVKLAPPPQKIESAPMPKLSAFYVLIMYPVYNFCARAV